MSHFLSPSTGLCQYNHTASNNLAEGQSHIRGRPNVEAIALDVADDAKMSELVEEADIVVR